MEKIIIENANENIKIDTDKDIYIKKGSYRLESIDISTTGTVEFEEGCFEDDFNLKEINIKASSIYIPRCFNDCIYLENINLENAAIEDAFSFSKKIIYQKVNINLRNCKKIEKSFKNTNIDIVKITDSPEIIESFINVEIFEGNFENITKEFLRNSKAQYIRIKNIIPVEGIIKFSTIKNLYIENIEEILPYTFQSSSFENLTIKNCSKIEDLAFDYCKINSFYIDSYVENKSNISVSASDGINIKKEIKNIDELIKVEKEKEVDAGSTRPQVDYKKIEFLLKFIPFIITLSLLGLSLIIKLIKVIL